MLCTNVCKVSCGILAATINAKIEPTLESHTTQIIILHPMGKHHSEDYKISAVQYYLKVKSYDKVYVKYIIVVNHHYSDGFKNIQMIKLIINIIKTENHIK